MPGTIENMHDRMLADFARKSIRFVESDQSYTKRRREVDPPAIEEGPLLTKADKLAMTFAFCGMWTDDPKMRGKTFCLGFEDEATGRIIYQTVPIQNFHYSPFNLVAYSKEEMIAVVEYDNETDPEHKLQWRLPLGGNFLRFSNHHFNQFDREHNLIPCSIIANPRSYCTEMCPGCARTAMGQIKESKDDYLNRHINLFEEDFARKFPGWPKSALQFVSVSTGCQPTRNMEAGMFKSIMNIYQAHGFNPGFMLFSNKIRRKEDLVLLKENGAVGYVATVECINDRTREQIWGGRKGEKTFVQHLRTLINAKRLFRFTEASFVFGEDNYEELMDGIRILGDMGITIVGNVLRSYDIHQLQTVSNDVWEMGLQYFVNIFEVALRLNEENHSSAKYLRRIGIDYLSLKTGRDVPDFEFPYKYRG